MPSTFKVEVVAIPGLARHPNADTLSLVHVEGYTAIVRTADFIGVARAAYVPVDAVVPVDRPEFAFLAPHAKAQVVEEGDGTAQMVGTRIKAARLRGVFSMGLLIPARPSWKVGDDVAAELGVRKYVPPEPAGTFGEDGPAPSGLAPHYSSIEHLRRYFRLFQPGEEVVVCEKVHGSNHRSCIRNNTFYVGSHTRWKKENPDLLYWKPVRDCRLREIVMGLPERVVLYGEVYGQVQDLRYGLDRKFSYAAFDIFDPAGLGRYLDFDEFVATCRQVGCPIMPVLWQGSIESGEALLQRGEELADTDSVVAGWHGCGGQIMEGVVVRPVRERQTPEIGRLILKLHSRRFQTRKGA